jgi:hypothetical protein
MEKNNDSLTSLQKISSFINTSFQKEPDKCRAIFFWVTKNIAYDPELIYTYRTNHNNPKLVMEILETRSGICTGYAALMDTLCKLCKLHTWIVEGSTKQSFLPSVIGHAWNAVKADGEWKIMDATWGSGHIKNQKFMKARMDHYFFPGPQQLIQTHLPIDPIWQLLARPVSLHQFHNGGNSTVKTDWKYTDSISAFLALSEIEQISTMIRRLTGFGNNSEVTFNYYNYLKTKEAEYQVKKLNHAGRVYNQASDLFNDYISFKNKQFNPLKSDAEIAKMIPTMEALIKQSKEEMAAVPKQFTENNGFYLESMQKHYKELESRLDVEKVFVKKYLATPKNRRKELFYVKVYGTVK